MRLSRYQAGLLTGVALVFAVREVVNRTPIADWLVAPLLTTDGVRTADAIVVPGAGVVGACAPNLNGVRRVLLATRLWQSGRAPLVVFAGGSGPPGCPVAGAMARLATEAGLPPSRIRVETSSRSTHENAAFTAPLLRGWGARRLLVVTDRLHVRRAVGAFAAAGFDSEGVAVPIYEGHLDNVSMLHAGLREYSALAYYQLRGWVQRETGPLVTGAPVDVADRRPGHAATSEERTSHAMNYPDGPLVLLGASYAANWPIREIAGVPVLNRGVAGEQAADLLGRFDRDVAAARPRAVLVWGFINDISRAPAGGMDAALARVRDSYEAMAARADAHGIPLLLASEVTMRPQGGVLDSLIGLVQAWRGKTSYQDVVNRHVSATNQWLAAFAQRRGIPWLDFHSVLSDERGQRRKPFAQPDGSHITPAGYDQLTSYAVPVIEEWLRER